MLTWVVLGISILLTGVQGQAAQLLDCDFEDDTCIWRSVRLWRRSSQTMASTGPVSDHTTGSGFYLRMQSSSEMRNMEAVLRSPLVNSVKGTCLTFWYYMYGYEVDTLTVYKKERGEAWQELLQVLGNQGTRWLKAVVDIGSGRFAFKITATYQGGNGQGDIAIDDISFSSEGNCQQQAAKSRRPVLDCDFEEDFCFWGSPYRGRVAEGTKRVTVSPSNKTMMTFAPYSDGSSFLRFERPHRYQREIVLIAPTIPIGKDGACMSFWYRQYQSYQEIIRFAIKKTDIGSSVEEMGLEGDTLLEPINQQRTSSLNTGIWELAQVNLQPGNRYFIYFYLELTWNNDPGSYIDIDDIKLNEDGPCKPVPQETVVNCDFDKDYCRWFSSRQKKEPEWIRRKGPTPTAFTGPPGDHTTGDGYYIHFKQPERYVSRIRTPPFQVSSTGACLTFWYYMYGEDITELTLFAEHNRGYENLLMIEGNQGDQWIQQNLSITFPGELSLTFSASKGYFPRADIALDDVSMTFDGVCDKDIVSTTTESTTETITTTTQARKWLPSPVLTIKGDTKPAMINSRVEIICGDHLDGASYTWLKKGEHEFDAIEGQDNRTLVYDKLGRSQEGTYMCSVAKDGYLNAESKTFDIEVALPQLPNPTLTVVGMENPVYQDSRIELICEHPNNDTEFLWHSIQGTTMTKLSETSHMLVFDEIQLGQMANYSCAVRKDGFLSAESEYVEIRVVRDPRPAPWLERNGGESPIEVNEKIEFRCGDEDVERGIFHWKTNSAAFASSPPPNSRILTIESSNPSHSGNYSCRISKDGYFTAKSNNLQLKVAPGKPCISRYSCWGNVHSGKCVNKRCECAKTAVFRGDGCVERPKSPKIEISPDFRKFAYGETFYLMCKVREPVPESLTYTFRKDYKVLGREGEPETYYIHKVANATSHDSGYYKCAVSSDGISSEYGDPLYIHIKEFVDLNCDFESQDACSWLHVDDPHAVNFTVEGEHSTSEESSKNASNNLYLRLPQRMDKQISRGFLRTPRLYETNLDSCLSFRYRMHGPEVYSLAVWRYSSLWKKSPDRHNLWTVIGDQGDRWVEKELTIESHSSIYLQFEAVGDVAIDDVEYVYRGSCSYPYF